MSLPPDEPALPVNEPALPAAGPLPVPPAVERRPFPGFWNGVLLIVLVQVLANVIAGFVIVGYMMASRVPLEAWVARMPSFTSIGIVANSLGFFSVIYLAWRRMKLPGRAVFPLRPVRLAWWLPILMMLAGGYILAQEVGNILVQVIPPPAMFKDIFKQVVTQWNPDLGLWRAVLHVLPSAVFLVIVAPITEESLFRGVILTGFLRRYSVVWAVIGSAFLFGVIHLDPWQLGPAIVLGVLFALWRVQTGSIWPALFAHAATNGLAFAQGLSQNPDDIFKPESTPLWVLALGAALLLAGLQWGVSVRRAEKS